MIPLNMLFAIAPQGTMGFFGSRTNMERKHLVDSENSDENKNKDSGIQYIKWKIQKLKQYLKLFMPNANLEILRIASELIIVFWHTIFSEVLVVIRQAIIKEDRTLKAPQMLLVTF